MGLLLAVVVINSSAVILAAMHVEARTGDTALHWAAMHGSLSGIKCYVERDANINLLNTSGATPLVCAIDNNNKECVDYLLECGAVSDPTGPGVRGCIYAAVNSSTNTEILHLLLDRGADPNHLTGPCTPLFAAAANGTIEQVQLLVDHGADVNLKTRHPPLQAALERKQFQIALYLLSKGADKSRLRVPAFLKDCQSPEQLAFLKEIGIDPDKPASPGVVSATVELKSASP